MRSDVSKAAVKALPFTMRMITFTVCVIAIGLVLNPAYLKLGWEGLEYISSEKRSEVRHPSSSTTKKVARPKVVPR